MARLFPSTLGALSGQDVKLESVLTRSPAQKPLAFGLRGKEKASHHGLWQSAFHKAISTALIGSFRGRAGLLFVSNMAEQSSLVDGCQDMWSGSSIMTGTMDAALARWPTIASLSTLFAFVCNLRHRLFGGKQAASCQSERRFLARLTAARSSSRLMSLSQGPTKCLLITNSSTSLARKDGKVAGMVVDSKPKRDADEQKKSMA